MSLPVQVEVYVRRFKSEAMTFRVIKRDRTTLWAQMYYRRVPVFFDYMDDSAREVCALVAEQLRDLMGKNVYFDVRRGRFTFCVLD